MRNVAFAAWCDASGCVCITSFNAAKCSRHYARLPQTPSMSSIFWNAAWSVHIFKRVGWRRRDAHTTARYSCSLVLSFSLAVLRELLK